MLGGGRAMKVRDVASAQGGHSPVQPWTPRQTLASDHCNHCLCVCWGGAGMGGGGAICVTETAGSWPQGSERAKGLLSPREVGLGLVLTRLGHGCRYGQEPFLRLQGPPFLWFPPTSKGQWLIAFENPPFHFYCCKYDRFHSHPPPPTPVYFGLKEIVAIDKKI